MNESFAIPPIKVAEVFVDGHCVGFLCDVKLSREEGGAFRLEGEWSGYSGVLDQESMFTISIPRYDCRFLSNKVNAELVTSSGRISFSDASFLPDGPREWFDNFGEAAEA